MTALSIIQEACRRIALTPPTILFASTDDLQVQLRGLLNEEVKSLSRMGNWSRLTKEKTFTTVAASIQTDAVPADFDWYVNDTMFNRTLDRKVFGELTAEQWQREQASSAASVYNSFRFRGGDILITPNPTAGQTIAYEYITKYRVADADGNEDQEVFVADDDYGLLDEELITQGVIWRWKQAKGFKYAEDANKYLDNLNKALSRDGGKKTINLTGNEYNLYFRTNVPETGFGS